MYVKLTNGQISQFPYTTGDLRRDNKNVSFSKNISDDVLLSYDVYPVKDTAPPKIDSRTHCEVQHIELIDGEWTIVWEVVELKLEQAENNIRAYRNNLLKNTDWTQLEDAVVVKQVWADYRQALRDVTSQEGFPYNVTWPVAP